MKKLVATCIVTGLAFGSLACSDPLRVSNLNNPDIDRALATPSGIEQVISTGYQQVHGEFVGCCPINAQAKAFSLETYASVANFGMGLRVSIARSAIQNDRGNPQGDGNYDNFRDLSKIARSMANAIQALDRLPASGRSLESPPSPGREARARAFAFFVMGVAQASNALMYDSVAVVTHKSSAHQDSIPPLVAYNVAMATALEMLDSAVVTASAVTSANVSAFGIPATWINGYAMTRDQFVQLVRSHRARFRAGVGRTPAERAAADWNAILADAQNGITADFIISLDNSLGWPHGELAQLYTYAGWHMMAPNYVGMADSAGGEYETWLATNMNRTNGDPTKFFFFRTADRRFPSGNTSALQIAASNCTAGNNNSACQPAGTGVNRMPYFRHRNGDDNSGDPWSQSKYDHYRFRYLTLGNTNRTGPWPAMTKAENDLLAAEAHIRAGNPAAAAALIDLTRVSRGGLPSAVGATGTFATYNSGTPVAGGNACVPRVPINNLSGRACGDLVEALKWEKRLETAYTGWNQWYVDARGWGDLPEGTAIHWPVPYQELDARTSGLTSFYTQGGTPQNGGTGKGNYGW